MFCKCGSKTNIVDTRETQEGTWRRHICKECKGEMNTIEQVCEVIPGKVGGSEPGAVKPIKGKPASAKPSLKSMILKKQLLIPKPVAVEAPKSRVNYIPARKRIQDMLDQKELDEND
jgi:hypothetical protein